jgi:ribonucleoside-diphosphate reductase alpha chain
VSFEPTGLGRTIFDERYAREEGETWDAACIRVASHVAAAEEDTSKWTDRFADQLSSGLFMPGGRIWYGAGRPKAQLLNCFVLPTSDSREGWGKSLSDTLVVSGLGGGVGINASVVRPRGTAIRGTGGTATGAVSFMQLIDGIGEVIRGGGGRRMALMLCLGLSHPDLLEFLSTKLDRGRLTNANVSVVLDEPAKDFVDKVQNGGSIHLRFREHEYGEVDAEEIWNKLVTNAHQSGEPGILNGWLANAENNIWYHKPLISTNPCGEIWLESYGCCDLGALVLPRFVRDQQIDWDVLDESVRLGVRFLDNVLTVNHYPLPEIAANCADVRRIGLGVMGLHSMLMELGIKYSSEDALNVTDKLFSFIKHTAYDESSNLAIEKGPFPAYSNALLESGYMKRMKRGIRNKIREKGLRNCALLTIAPTGTTGMVQGVTTGIEPLFAPAYYRRRWVGDVKAKSLVVSNEYARHGDLAEGAYDIPVEQHFEMQVVVQQHIDNAVSKTINLPADYPVDALAEVWLEYLPYLKGTTLYRAGSRGEEPLEALSINEAAEAATLVEAQTGMTMDQYAMDCVDGVCEV